MNTPPFLIGATLLFWGWQAGFLWFGAAGAVILEGSRLLRLRWDLSPTDLKRVIYLCDLLLIGGIVYVFLTAGRANFVDAMISLLQATPLAILPLIVAQTYSTANKIDINLLRLVVRKKPAQKKDKPPRLVDLSYPYFAICLLSASAANIRTPWFYAGFAVLLAWVLWGHRQRAFKPVIWALLLASVGGLGFVGHIGLNKLQGVVEEFAVAAQVPDEAPDAYKSKTAIGRIGSLKLSEKILLRVMTGKEGPRPPFLLQDAGYDLYGASTWFARGSVFKPVKPGQDGTTWDLNNTPAPKKSMSISAYLKGGKGILALPRGASHIENLPVRDMKVSGFGTVTVGDGPALVHYMVRFDTNTPQLAPPQEADLKFPHNMSPVLLKLVDDLQLKTRSPHEIIQTVTRYFNDNFHYSTYTKSVEMKDPIQDFLVRSHSGHCEYFATATVLVLRAAGIPARYATGYSVQEYSPLEKTYIVRSKHAHAWTLAFVDGVWRDVDTTPSSWFDAEKSDSGFTAVTDLWSWLVFKVSGLVWGDKESGFAYYMLWIAVPIIIALAWRLYFKKQVFLRKTNQKKEAAVLPQTGQDSELYAIERELARLGLGRQKWEPLNIWISRIAVDAAMPDLLQQIVSLHYRYRFDPDGLNPEEREALKEAARTWLTNIDKR
jgi:protein-glutamine gamma-glutamyltransferase